MKSVLLVTAVASTKPDSMNWFPLRDLVREELGRDTQIDMTSLTSLIFDISKDGARVVDSLSGHDISTYDFVVVRNVGDYRELGIALVHYLELKGIQYTDEYLNSLGAGKLACSMLQLRNGLPFPHTIFAPPSMLLDYIEESGRLEFPIILKADRGRKGRHNYLIKERMMLKETLSKNPEVAFIAQEFIPNDGDYRALVLNNEVAMVIKRTASEGSHLNNTSQGGEAKLEDASVFSKDLLQQIVDSARIEKLDVAGVDVMIDNRTGQHYFLEVNRAPQIGSGAFAKEKVAAYAKMIKDKMGTA